MGKNNIGLDYKYNKILDAMRAMGRDALRQGVSPQVILAELKCLHPDLYIAKNEIEYVRATLSTYKVGQPKLPRSRRPELFQPLGNGFWTLPSLESAPKRRRTSGRKIDSVVVRGADTGADKSVRQTGTAFEGLAALKRHCRRERSNLAQKFKSQLLLYQCEVCKFDFGRKYGALGGGFIEAHHILPLHSGERLTRLEDFRAVCSNCHSMLHWKGSRTVDDLRTVIAVQSRDRRFGL